MTKNNESFTPETAKAIFWGPNPLPEGAVCIGSHTDPITGRTGALIEFDNGIRVLGNSGVLYVTGKSKKDFFNRQWSVHGSQIQGLVKERNEYRRLLKKALYAFNVLRNQRISESRNGTTYALASEIDAVFKQFDNGGGKA